MDFYFSCSTSQSLPGASLHYSTVSFHLQPLCEVCEGNPLSLGCDVAPTLKEFPGLFFKLLFCCCTHFLHLHRLFPSFLQLSDKMSLWFSKSVSTAVHWVHYSQRGLNVPQSQLVHVSPCTWSSGNFLTFFRYYVSGHCEVVTLVLHCMKYLMMIQWRVCVYTVQVLFTVQFIQPLFTFSILFIFHL